MENTNRAGSTALTFLLGGAVGAAAALLFAPHKGADTRHRIARGAHDLRSSGENFAHGVEDKAEAVGGAIKSAVTEAKDTYKSELEKAHDSSQEAAKQAAGSGPSKNKTAAESHA